MKNYEVYFSFYGHKMRTTILANSYREAKQKIIDKIKWDRIEEKKNDEFNESINYLDEINKIING